MDKGEVLEERTWEVERKQEEPKVRQEKREREEKKKWDEAKQRRDEKEKARVVAAQLNATGERAQRDVEEDRTRMKVEGRRREERIILI